jgi:hypothetical protein
MRENTKSLDRLVAFVFTAAAVVLIGELSAHAQPAPGAGTDYPGSEGWCCMDPQTQCCGCRELSNESGFVQLNTTAVLKCGRVGFGPGHVTALGCSEPPEECFNGNNTPYYSTKTIASSAPCNSTCSNQIGTLVAFIREVPQCDTYQSPCE